MSNEIKCKDCAFDLEDFYCAHASSMHMAKPFGLSINAARRAGAPCGPEARLFIAKNPEASKAE